MCIRLHSAFTRKRVYGLNTCKPWAGLWAGCWEKALCERGRNKKQCCVLGFAYVCDMGAWDTVFNSLHISAAVLEVKFHNGCITSSLLHILQSHLSL